jgi:hypothetical protein
MKKLITVCVVAGLLLTTNAVASLQLNGTTPPESHASPMPLDGTWIVLDEGMPVGGFFTGSGDGFWDWNSSLPVVFAITDLYVVTDAFNVYDSGNLVLSTPLLPDWSALGLSDPFLSPPWTGNPDEALANPLFSKGVITFGAGYHKITIQDTQIPTGFSDGTVAFKAIPEPATVALLGLGALSLLRRRK